MKKNILISSLVVLLSFPTFVGCDNNNSSSSQITSNNSQDIITQ